jgi:hypothetical protein
MQTSMQLGFEPPIPAFNRAKTVHGLDQAATVIGNLVSGNINITKLVTAAHDLHFPVNISKTKKKRKTNDCKSVYR